MSTRWGASVIRLQCLFLSLCAVVLSALSAAAQPLPLERRAGAARPGQRLIVCTQHWGCRSLRLRPGCRVMMLGGASRHNIVKVVCDQAA